MEKKNNILLVVLTAVVLLILFALVLFIFNKKGYLSFNIERNQTEKTNNINDGNSQDNIISDDVNTNNDNKIITKDDNTSSSNTNTANNASLDKATTNMTNEEIFKLWEKIKGNWANVEYKNELCVGSAVEINNFMKFAKFNSDGIMSWSIVSYNKINENQYKVNLMTPVDLYNQMSGDVVAHYSTAIIDISKLNSKVLRVSRNGGDSFGEYQYVGENTVKVENFQYIDGGFSQDKYCEWYKENHK